MNACLSTSIDIISLVNNYSFYPSCANKDFNFIIKGGFLISAIVGLDTRTTMDLDTTIKGLTLNHDSIRTIFEDGCTLLVNDNKHAIYQYGDYGLSCIFLGNDNHYYSLISQGDKDALNDKYDWIL